MRRLASTLPKIIAPMKPSLSRLLLLVPIILGIATHWFTNEDNRLSNSIEVRNRQLKLDGKPPIVGEPRTSWVPLLSLSWLTTSVMAGMALIVSAIVYRRLFKLCALTCAINLVLIAIPARWYPPPLKSTFPSNLRKWTHKVDKTHLDRGDANARC